MKKVLSIIILVLALVAPVQRLDVAKLQPVESVALYCKDDMLVLETDTGETGEGKTAKEALVSLKANAARVIYMDTVEYLLVADSAQAFVPELRPYLKKTVKVAAYYGGSVEEETDYWEIRGHIPTLESWTNEK